MGVESAREIGFCKWGKIVILGIIIIHKYSTMSEQVVETRVCRACGTSFGITDGDMAFYEKVSPSIAGKKYPIPPPTHCPECREIRRFVWRNERKLYRRPCAQTGKSILSIFSPDKSYTVYDAAVWWSDSWDELSYGREFDFSRPFFEQFSELQRVVPVLALKNDAHNSDVNSEYTNEAGYNRNCYLVFNAGVDEDCMYGYGVSVSKNCVDCFRAEKCEYLYECVDAVGCYGCSFCQDIRDSSHCQYCFACTQCRDCFGGQQYCIYNKPYPKEEYTTRVAELRKLSRGELRHRVAELASTYPRRHNETYQSENVSGNHLYYSKNAHACYDSLYLEDCKWCFTLTQGSRVADVYDYTFWGQDLSRCYEVSNSGGNLANIYFSASVQYDCANVFYSEKIISSSNVFGCVGLRNKSYCILNKQYTPAEYEALVPRIIEHMRGTGEWGEFFPSAIAPFGYNETPTQDYDPLSREEALARGFSWCDYEAPSPTASNVIP